MTTGRPTPYASWSSAATKLRAKRNTSPTPSPLPHSAQNGSSACPHNFEPRESTPHFRLPSSRLGNALCLNWLAFGFMGCRDISCSGLLKDVARAVCLVACFSMDRNQQSAFFKPLFVKFRLVLWNSHADEHSDRSSCRSTGECAEQRPRNQQWSNAWYS